MKYWVILQATLSLIFLHSTPADAEIKRVLAIGNSFSADAVEEHLWQLAAEAGDTLVIGNAYIGGCTLDRHLKNLEDKSSAYSYRKITDGTLKSTENMTLQDIIADEPWNVISLQQASPLSGKKDSYVALPRLISLVKKNMPNKDAEIVWHNTWAYAEDFKSDNFKHYGNDQQTMFDSIVAVTTQIIPAAGIRRIIPSGIAVQNARVIFGDVLCRDGFHLALPLGRYVAACTWMEFLTGKDATKLNYRPESLTEEEAAKARLAAHNASGYFRLPKRVSILGDSYSTFEGCVEPNWNAVWYFNEPKKDKTDLTSPDQTWWRLLLRDENYTLEKNNSFSGSTICTTGYDGNDYSDRSFISRMYNLGNPDLILIFGATNDSWANAPIGEYVYDGWTAEGLKSFRPALTYFLSSIKSLYPDADLLYIVNDGLKPEITGSLIETCKRYEVPYLCLDGIDKTAGHPNINGMRQIADQVGAFLSTHN